MATSLAIDIEGSVTETLDMVLSFLPKLLMFLVILLIGWIIAKAVSKGLGMLLHKVGFTKLLDKAGADDVLSNANIEPISLITKLVYYFILLIALQLALGAFGPSNPVSQIVNDIVAWLPRAIVAIVIIVIAAAVANAVKDILSGVLGGLSYGSTLAKIAAAFIVALGVIAALNQVGIAMSVTLPVLIAVLATIGGIAVVGVGGGLIGPMRTRWEGWLNNLEQDARRAKATRPADTTTGYSTTAPTGTTQPGYTQPGTTQPGYTDPGGSTTQY